MNENVGERLRLARESRLLSLEQASGAIHIKARFLDALERGEWGELPSAVQVKGFLRSYAQYLGLDSAELLAGLQTLPQPTVSELAAPEASEISAEEQAAAEAAARQADEIFFQLGDALRERREMLGLSSLDVAENTHIPEHYLARLEAGQVEQFPSPVQARGMLTNYADFLSLDKGRILLQYAEGLQARLAARQAALPERRTRAPRADQPIRTPAWVRKYLSGEVVLIALGSIALVSFVIWGLGRVLSTRASQTADPTAPSLVSVLLPSATEQPLAAASSPTATFDLLAGGETGEQATAQASVRPTLPPNPAGFQIMLVARQRAWVRVTVDGVVELDAQVAPGATFTYQADERVEILTGNGAAFQVFFNNQDLGPLGVLGEVVDVVFTGQGQVLPTALPTSTPTATIEPTQTPTPTEPGG